MAWYRHTDTGGTPVSLLKLRKILWIWVKILWWFSAPYAAHIASMHSMSHMILTYFFNRKQFHLNTFYFLLVWKNTSEFSCEILTYAVVIPLGVSPALLQSAPHFAISWCMFVTGISNHPVSLELRWESALNVNFTINSGIKSCKHFLALPGSKAIFNSF